LPRGESIFATGVDPKSCGDGPNGGGGAKITVTIIMFNFSGIDAFRMLNDGAQLAFDKLECFRGSCSSGSMVGLVRFSWINGTSLKKKQVLSAI